MPEQAPLNSAPILLAASPTISSCQTIASYAMPESALAASHGTAQPSRFLLGCHGINRGRSTSHVDHFSAGGIGDFVSYDSTGHDVNVCSE